MAARLLPGGHSTTTSLLPDGYPPATRLLPACCPAAVCLLSVCLLHGDCPHATRLLPACYLSVAFCADFVEIFPKILVNQEKFVSL